MQKYGDLERKTDADDNTRTKSNDPRGNSLLLLVQTPFSEVCERAPHETDDGSKGGLSCERSYSGPRLKTAKQTAAIMREASCGRIVNADGSQKGVASRGRCPSYRENRISGWRSLLTADGSGYSRSAISPVAATNSDAGCGRQVRQRREIGVPDTNATHFDHMSI